MSSFLKQMLSRSTMTEEKAKDEIAAELAERFMTDEEAVTAFIRTNRTAAQRFFDVLRSIIQTIKEALGGERTLAQSERLWKRAFEKAEASSRAEALSRSEASSQADSRENEVYLGILFDKWAKGEITNEELDRAFSELSDVSDMQYSIKNTRNMPWEEQLKKHKHSDTLVIKTGIDTFLDGVDNLPLAIPVSVISKAQSQKDDSHSISNDSIKKLQNGLNNAPVIIDNPKRNSIVYITDIKDGSGLVTISFLKNQIFDGDYVHKATSIHTRTDPLQMLNHLEEGATVYIRKNKLDAVPGSSLLKSGTLNTNIKFISKISQKGGNVNREYSYKTDYEDYLNALEQDEEGTKSNYASLEENAPPEREEADGFDEVYEYLMDADLAQYDRDHENKLNALADSEAPEETAPPTITRKDLDDYSKLIL